MPAAPGRRDCGIRDPEIAPAENSLDVEARRLTWMMTPQSLQILSPEDSFPRLRIIANGIVIAPVAIQGFRYLFLLAWAAPPLDLGAARRAKTWYSHHISPRRCADSKEPFDQRNMVTVPGFRPMQLLRLAGPTATGPPF